MDEPYQDAGSPIEVYIAPQVLRAQEADYANVTATGNEVSIISTSPPKSDNYIAGSVATEYEAKYIFKTPLTFTTVEGGVINYFTFITSLDQE